MKTTLTDEPEIQMPGKGQSLPLLYSREARQRVVVGVRWDAREEVLHKTRKSTSDSPKEGEGGYDNPYTYEVESNVNLVTQTYDIDLVCLIFDENKELIDAVSPDPAESIDQSGKIYHSGDETRGVRGSDDETISVELKDLPGNIAHLVFVAICQSGHSFDQIVTPEGRVTDSRSGADLLVVPMGGAAARGKTACILARLFRGPEDWMVHHIGEFRVDREIESWGAEASVFIK